MRLKHKPWANEYIQDNPQIFIQNVEQLKEYMQTGKEIRFELGTGKGQFIYQHAKNNPDILFIGVERYKSVIVTAGQKLEEEPLPNLRLWAIDVAELMSIDFLKNSLDIIYLNFSDPWPKKRHIKRRLTSETFLPTYDYLLKENGHIQFKTDNQGLFEYSLESFPASNWKISNISLDLHNTDRENIKTEYEERFSAKGFRINYLEARR